MAQVLHWLLLFSCQPSETLQQGLKHAPLCFSNCLQNTMLPVSPFTWVAG